MNSENNPDDLYSNVSDNHNFTHNNIGDGLGFVEQYYQQNWIVTVAAIKSQQSILLWCLSHFHVL